MAGSGTVRPWRLLDTGTLSATENIAIDSALLDLRSDGTGPDTIRFLKFAPDAVLVGYHQTVDQEVRTSFCLDRGIDVNRRITGGGAVYLDASQIGWELIATRAAFDCGPTMAHLTEAVCRAAARGLELLGITASYRPRNDIEVAGRKISGTGGAREGDAFLFQGTLLVDFDIETMLQALRVPTEKLTRHEIDSAGDRVTCVRQCLATMPTEDEIKAALAQGFCESLGISLAPGQLLPEEDRLAASRRESFASDAWIRETAEPRQDHQLMSSIQLTPGGTIRTSAAFDAGRDRIRSVLFTGDFFVDPQRAIYDLENELRYCRYEDLESRVEAFFSREQPDCSGLTPDDFISGVRKAHQKLIFTSHGLTYEQAEAVTLVGVDENADLTDILPAVGAVLLPYCAKLADCEFRFQEGCDECGDCSIGDAFSLARDRGIEPITVQSYAGLLRAFAACRDGGIQAYVGCCCEAFQVKRSEAFSQAGLAGILLGIEDETCYDLSREEDAYAGRFREQTHLKTGLLAKLLSLLPAATVEQGDGAHADAGL